MFNRRLGGKKIGDMMGGNGDDKNTRKDVGSMTRGTGKQLSHLVAAEAHI